MSLARRRYLAGLSLLCTAVVLVAGGGRQPSPAVLRAALARHVVVPVAAPAVTPDPVAAATPAAPAVTAAPASAPSAPAPSLPRSRSAGAPTATPTPQPTATPVKRTPSKAGHVFVIALSAGDGDPFAASSPASYLAGELRPQGTLLAGFAPLDAAELPNYIAITGGQPPNADTRGECATYTDFPSGATVNDDGTLTGDGCVYPNTVLSLADQVTASGRSWRAYAGGMDQGVDPAQACRHPDSGAADATSTAAPAAGETYATRHNPFVYFHSLLDLGDCIAQDGPLDRLTTDLEQRAGTPDYAFIAPDLCDSGTLASCPDGRPGGLAGADAFLHTWVPRILASAAYRKDGALIVLFLARAPGAAAATTPTQGLVVSRFARAGATLPAGYDPYSALRSIEDLLGLDPLGFAAQAKSFARAALPGAFE